MTSIALEEGIKCGMKAILRVILLLLASLEDIRQFSLWKLGTPTVASSVLLNAPTPEVEVKGHAFAQKGICYNGGTLVQNSFHSIAMAYTLYTWGGLGTSLIWI